MLSVVESKFIVHGFEDSTQDPTPYWWIFMSSQINKVHNSENSRRIYSSPNTTNSQGVEGIVPDDPNYFKGYKNKIKQTIKQKL